MINGTQFMAALACEALVRAEHIAKLGTIVGALTLDVLHGTHRAFAPQVGLTIIT